MDFSGVIKQVGENVPSDFKQGDEVYGQASVLRVVQEHLLNWL
jgi:NADPH:quinone reductase-like Zn-dependent oxidoreductase